MNCLAGLGVPTAVWLTSRNLALTVATLALSIAGALTFTAMEPTYAAWSPKSRFGIVARHCVDTVSSLRKGRGHHYLLWTLTVFLSAIGVVTVVMLLVLVLSAWE